MMNYLISMAVRIMELKRVLKPTGSLYPHCDPTASHYLKLLPDTILGRKNFQSEITWKRNSAHNDSRTFGNIKDALLFYGASINTDAIRVPLDPAYVKTFYRHHDDRGKYRRRRATPPKSHTPYWNASSRPHRMRATLSSIPFVAVPPPALPRKPLSALGSALIFPPRPPNWCRP